MPEIAPMNLQKSMTYRSNYLQILAIVITADLTVLVPLWFQNPLISSIEFLILINTYTWTMVIIGYYLHIKRREYDYTHVQALSVDYLHTHMYEMPYIPTDKEIEQAVNVIHCDLRFDKNKIYTGLMEYYKIYKT